ncbi:unnamed protein product [Strongylus vulgaris]|uniref:Uncharacterized protein n=1 Tax=Strongylus vulgaris TaxID=40348 RepID=A0A3P7J5X5_STRVU|nr:unnamed protein product [Strongylus vulgaris]
MISIPSLTHLYPNSVSSLIRHPHPPSVPWIWIAIPASDSSSPSSFCSLDLDCDPGENSLSVFPYDDHPSPLLGMPDPIMPAIAMNDSLATTTAPTRRPMLVRKRMHECSMVCWLFRTLLTSEYRALPLNAIFEIFEDTLIELFVESVFCPRPTLAPIHTTLPNVLCSVR